MIRDDTRRGGDRAHRIITRRPRDRTIAGVRRRGCVRRTTPDRRTRTSRHRRSHRDARHTDTHREWTQRLLRSGRISRRRSHIRIERTRTGLMIRDDTRRGGDRAHRIITRRPRDRTIAGVRRRGCVRRTTPDRRTRTSRHRRSHRDARHTDTHREWTQRLLRSGRISRRRSHIRIERTRTGLMIRDDTRRGGDRAHRIITRRPRDRTIAGVRRRGCVRRTTPDRRTRTSRHRRSHRDARHTDTHREWTQRLLRSGRISRRRSHIRIERTRTGLMIRDDTRRGGDRAHRIITRRPRDRTIAGVRRRGCVRRTTPDRRTRTSRHRRSHRDARHTDTHREWTQRLLRSGRISRRRSHIRIERTRTGLMIRDDTRRGGDRAHRIITRRPRDRTIAGVRRRGCVRRLPLPIVALAPVGTDEVTVIVEGSGHDNAVANGRTLSLLRFVRQQSVYVVIV